MRTKTPAHLPIFRSHRQAEVLRLLFLQPQEEWTIQRLADATDAPYPSVARELQRLSGAGLIEQRRVGRMAIYSPAEDSPLYEPLLELVRRGLGLESELRERLKEIEGIEAAAIFGSWARADLRPTSDIDVVVVGHIDFGAVSAAVEDLQERFGREINIVAFTPEELRNELIQGSGFVQELLRTEPHVLLGDFDLARLGGEGVK